MFQRPLSPLLICAGLALLAGCAGGDGKDKAPPDLPEGNTVRTVDLVLRPPAQALVKVNTVGTARGPLPVEVRRCERTAQGQLRLTIRLWDKEERNLQAQLPEGWDPPASGVQVSVVVDKVPRLEKGDTLDAVMIEDQLWQVVAKETVPLSEANQKD